MLAKKFKESYGTIICRELLKLEDKTFSPTPEKRTDEYYKNRPCEKIIEQAAKIIEENILD